MIIEALCFLCQVKKVLPMVCFNMRTIDEEGLNLYISSDFSQIKLFVNIKRF